MIKFNGSNLAATSKVPWAGIHQYGGTAGHGAKIPARPFLWFSQKFLKQAKEIMLTEAFRGWKEG